MRRRSGAVSNDPIAAEAARDLLTSGGSAVAAVVAGFFAAAGAYAGVLLGPVSILVGGVGVGARAFDGRMRQPGLGAKRPRGVLSGQDVPEAALVAVPTSVGAAAVALAYDGGLTLSSVLRTGVSRAERSGASSRASVLKLVRSAGAGAFLDSGFVRSMLRVTGPSQGGQLSPADFAAVPDIDVDAVAREVAGRKLFEVPWAGEPGEKHITGLGFAICSVDHRGVFAALEYRRVTDGFVIDELELEAPLAAVPVRRGVARTAPGARLLAPAPIALLCDASGRPVEVVAAPGALTLGERELEAPALRLRRSATTQEVEVVAG